MSKCIRRYYSKEKNQIVNEICDFTKSNYSAKFKEWLEGEYEIHDIDEKLTKRGIVAFFSNKHDDFREWINVMEPKVWKVIDEYEEQFEPIYIKGCMIFCKINNKGFPMDLTKEDIKFLESFIIKYERKVRRLEEEIAFEISDQPKQDIENNYDQEIVEALIKKRESLLVAVNHYYDSLNKLIDSFENQCNGMVEYIQDEDPELMKKVKENLEKVIHDSGITKGYYIFLKEHIEKALENKDDLFEYLVAYFGCLNALKECDQEYKDRIEKILKIYTNCKSARKGLKRGDFQEVEEDCQESIRFINEILEGDLDSSFVSNDPKDATKKMHDTVEVLQEIDEIILKGNK